MFDAIVKHLYETHNPTPSSSDDVQAILHTYGCILKNKPPLEEYDTDLLKDDTEQGCRIRMVLGTIAFAKLELGDQITGDALARADALHKVISALDNQ